mmetsp:Transcript_37601/g.53010  ORF Transcript_37601/g.53010 Transcript_37601/m.53010 type:complete len:1380 (-) Transcript_37601:246-4385(-)
MCELDSHADTCVVGKNVHVTHVHDRTVTVTGYDPSQEAVTGLQVVSAQVAYDMPDTGQVVLLTIHQAIQVPTMEHNLLCPMQLRMNDCQVAECPKFLMSEPNDNSHSITTRSVSGVNITIPLRLRGVTSYFPCRKPTQQDLQAAVDEYELTSHLPEWDPHDTSYEEQEDSHLDHQGKVTERIQRTPQRMFAKCHSRGSYIGHAGIKNNKELGCARIRALGDRYSQTSSVLSEVSNTLNDDTFHQALVDQVCISSAATSKRKGKLSPESLSSRWGIGLDTAARTLKVTTQRGIRTVANPMLSRRFRTNDRHLRYRRLRTDVFGDTMFSGQKSTRGNTCAQVFATSFHWSRAFPIPGKGSAHEALSLMFKRDGVPMNMIVDGSREQVAGDFKRKCIEADCRIKQLEPHSQWANAAEASIRELKKASARKQAKMRSPKKLWDHSIELEAFIRSHTVNSCYALGGEVPETFMTGETADISEIAEFGWYDWVMFRDTTIPYPEDKVVLGRYLGPSTDVGPAMTAKVLTINGQVRHRSTLRSLTDDELKCLDHKRQRDEFDREIERILGPGVNENDLHDPNDPHYGDFTPSFEYYADGTQAEIPMVDRDDLDHDFYDQYLNADVTLSIHGEAMQGKVKRRKVAKDGGSIGRANANPILDTREYLVEFPDGREAEYSANTIAEGMWSQCDLDGNQYILLKAIVDHKTDGHKVHRADKYIHHNGRRSLRKTTKGWHMCVEWKDGSTTWERLADVKESNPVQLAEYAVANGLEDEPAFAWWVPYTLRKRDRIIASVNKRYHKRTHKFGIRVPKTVEEAIQIDLENGNTLWQDAIAKEMKNVRVAFDIKAEGASAPVGFQEIKCHMIFDVKMENFRRKARLVAGGHMTETPATLTYASVVSRESVRIALTIAALNDLQVKAGDILNAYLTAPVSERIWCRCGLEFGQDAGRIAIVKRALYGLKSSGASFRNHLADCMRELGYKPCQADPDLWLKPEVRPEDGFKYYAYALLYVDDILIIHHDGNRALKAVDKFFPMKPDSMGDPDFYLGAKVRLYQLPNGVKAWALCPSKYVQDAVRNVKEYAKENISGFHWVKKATAPFPRGYEPECDISRELKPELASMYSSQIGVLRWMVELGRIDIQTEVSMLASHLALPREGHLEALLHIYSYLDDRHNSRMVFDPTYPTVNKDEFQTCDWKEFYGDVKETIPINAPEPRGKDVDLRLFVDADFAGDKINRRSRTGFIAYINMAPVAWSSKKQATIETSVFGSEFVALKHGMEYIRGLRYKLRMMGVPLSGPAYVYGDNMSVIQNTSRPESTLKKKSHSVCYHAVRESVAMGEIVTAHVRSEENVADLCTKVIPGGMKRQYLVTQVLYDVYEQELSQRSDRVAS